MMIAHSGYFGRISRRINIIILRRIAYFMAKNGIDKGIKRVYINKKITGRPKDGRWAGAKDERGKAMKTYARSGQTVIVRPYGAAGETTAHAIAARGSRRGNWITAIYRPRSGEYTRVIYHDGGCISGNADASCEWWSATLTIPQAYARRCW